MNDEPCPTCVNGVANCPMHSAYVGPSHSVKAEPIVMKEVTATLEEPAKPPMDDMDELMAQHNLGSPDALNEEHIKFLTFLWMKQVEELDYQGKNSDADKLRHFVTQMLAALKAGMWAIKHKGVVISCLSSMIHGADELSFLSTEEIDSIRNDAQKALDETTWSKE